MKLRDVDQQMVTTEQRPCIRMKASAELLSRTSSARVVFCLVEQTINVNIESKLKKNCD